MNGIAGVLLFVCAALAQAGNTVLPPAPPSREDVSRLAARLGFTSKGVPRWLAALGVGPEPNAVERLLLVSLSGEIVASRDGGHSRVNLTRDIDDRLLASPADLVIVHNHPANASLSTSDLLQLSKPGVAAIVAVAHDASLYLAVRGPCYDRQEFEARQYGPVRMEIANRLRLAWMTGQIRQEAVDGHFSHVAALALAKAGVIEYRAVLSPRERESFESASVLFSQIVTAAAGAVGATQGRVACRRQP